MWSGVNWFRTGFFGFRGGEILDQMKDYQHFRKYSVG
jgi:hypothetical protein